MAIHAKKLGRGSKTVGDLSKKKKFKFCDVCASILLPKPGNKSLFCRVCNQEYKISEQNVLELYRKKKKQPQTQKKGKIQKNKTIIVESDKDSGKHPSITDDERETFEDLFVPPEID